MPDETKPQKLKKSETLEVRIPYETKQAFLTACREDGTTASEVVRQSVQTYLDERARPVQQPERTNIVSFTAKLTPVVRRYGPRVAASGLAAIAFTTFAALPSAAAPGLEATFKSLDANGDGELTIEEFAIPPAGVKQMSLRKAERAMPLNPVAAGPEAAAVYVILPDADGKAAEQQRAVRFQAMGAAPPPSSQDRRRADFANYDANRDGRMNFDEYRTRFNAMLGNGFTRLDQDNSGALDQAEYQAQSLKLLSYPVDAITALGIAAGYGPVMSPEALDAEFIRLDRNKDGKLAREEYLPPA